MSNTNCPNCDRADCPTFTMPEESEWQNTREDAEAIEAAIADCNANRVDWRARALTEAARADAAEARIVDASREARLIISQAASNTWWVGVQQAAGAILARLEIKP